MPLSVVRNVANQGTNMKTKSFVLCLAAVLPFGFTAAAHAQSSAPVQPASAPEDSGDYSLKGSALKAPSTTAPAATPYELTGTSISGAASTTAVILTAPVGANAAAYKTESGVYFYPAAFAAFGYNDNLLSDATKSIGSSFVNVAPQVIAELKHKGDRYTAKASLDATRYANSSEDNYANSAFELAGDNYFSSRARAGWSIGQVNNADPRGSNNRAISTEPDRWHATNANGRMIYGAPEAQGRVEVDLGTQVKTYDNNRVNTDVADLTLNSFAGRAFYRLGTRTLALVELRNANANYASALSTDSNTERRYYAGLTWEATAATTGIVKIGRMTKDFEFAGKEGFSGSSWEATVRWLPRTYSAIDFTTARSTADASGFGDYILNTSTDVVWNHKWTQSLSSRISAGVLTSEYGGTNRTDTANNYALTVDYAVLRWLKVGVDLARTDNSSTDASAAYKRNVTMFTLNASL